ncbi:glycosyl hydrolase family 28-related protein [Cohnella luojiensis]|uniref:S-layer protein n=1 Tax=Cohnella luojiensis TaxID=652876 RepID=A0A4Y8M285_9BACL|nr:glycosyl hydrolase family 28-related protein [Cohnella luojiensis]TFE29398.1 S-layer protein [Cohnella luojiensis]
MKPYQHPFRAALVYLLVILLVTSSLNLHPSQAQASEDAVSITLGETPSENGIQARAGDNPDGLQTGTVDGKTYWQTDKLTGTVYFYMNVDDNFLFDNADYNVQVAVDYYDAGNGKMVLQYDSESAEFKDAPLFQYGDSNAWKTYTFQLSDAKFANRTGGSDFRLGIEGGGASASTNEDLKVASVTVTKMPKPAPPEQVSVTLGEVPIEQGISPRAGDAGAGLQTGTDNGKTYWQTNRASGISYLYMNVDDGYLYDNTDKDVLVTVEYYDQGSGSFALQYDAVSASFKDSPLFTYKNTGLWKTHTFKLSDAKFANRTNGGDFRLAVDGAGSPANNPDLRVASVTVKKVTKVIIEKNTQIITTDYATDDIVLADYNVAEFGAAGDGVTDDTRAIQDVLDAAGNNGGGVVFVPSGRYRIAGTLFVPTGVTLRGDWNGPETGGAVEGTVLQAYAGRGNADDTSFIQLQQASGVTNLSVWYPEQQLGAPNAYPWTIEQLSGDSATVENVTLVNSYNGVKIGPAWNELHYLKNVYGTALNTGIFLDYTTDIGRLEGIRLSPDYWANSGLPGAPSRQQLFDYMTTHAEGIVMGRSDWEYMSDVRISGFKTGMRVTTRTGSTETANAQFYRLRIEDCNVALKIEGVNGYGLLITDSSFEANVGTSPIAIHATEGFQTIVQFNNVTIGGSPLNAVVNEGDGVLSFENSSIDAWNDLAGGYAIVAESGSLILGQTEFAKAGHHVSLGSDAKIITSVNSGNEGTLDLLNNSLAAEVKIDRDSDYSLEPLPAVAQLDIAVQPKPNGNQLFDVTAAPYNADDTGAADVSAIVQQALSDAGTSGGGTVYLPAGIYRIEQPITVPTGVELRGSWDVPHHTIGGGSVIFTNHGEGDTGAIPLISLEADSGIRGLNVYYDQQNWNAIKAYGWTIQGKGHGVYAIDTTLVDSYLGIDFGTYDTSGHYIDYVAGSPLKEGIYIGGGSSGGIVRNVQFNPHYAGRSTYPNRPMNTDSDKIWNYQKENLDAFRIGNATGETIFNTFVYGSLYGIHFVAENGQGPEAVVIGHGTDGSKKGVYVEGAGAGGLSFVNTELVSMSTSDKVYVTVGDQFDSEVTFHNTSMWGDTTRSFDIFAGKVRIQQSNLTVVGQIGVNAIGGDITLYDSYFQQAGTTHVYAGPDIERLRVTNNLFNGGIKLDNQAPAKVTGTNVVPISLDLTVTPFDAEHPENTNAALELRNLSIAQPVKGMIELIHPVEYKSKMIPVRFQDLGIGSTLTIPLPYIGSDIAKFKVTLEDGYAYTTSVRLGQTFAVQEQLKKPDAPPVLLNSIDQYASVGGQWGGVNDLSAQANVKWDNRNLYFTVSVKDDTHFQSWQNGDIWQGDSIQIGIDPSRKDGSSSQNVSEMGFALSNDGTTSAWRWRAPTGVTAGALSNAQANIVRDENTATTIYTIAIPIAELHGPGFVFSPNDPIGFTLLVNENDGAGRSGFLEYNKGIGSSKDATTFGDLHLLAGEFSKIQSKSAVKAVLMAAQQRTVTAIDTARNFLNLLLDNVTKNLLDAKLKAIFPKK